MNTKTWTAIGGLAVVAIALIFVLLRTQGVTPPPVVTGQTTVAFACNEGKSITATYTQGETKPAASADQPPIPGGSVALTLSDGRTMTLNQTLSADGARFANADESFVFWGKGNGALVLENNQQKSYIGCIAIAPAPTGENLAQVYANSAAGFSIRLPSIAASTSLNVPDSYRVDESYQYQALGPGKGIKGIKFTIPQSMATGTNLSADSYLSVEEIPQTENCSAALFLDQGIQAQTVVESQTTYSVASSTDAAAGNRYEETVYAVPGTNPCVAVRYLLHYGVLQNYPKGAVQEFERDAILKQFDAIRRTLIIVQ